MKGPRSLRARFVLGSILWTGGFLALVHMSMMHLLPHFRFLARLPTHLVVVLGLATMLAGLQLVRGGLAPLRQLRGRLADLRAGRASSLGGDYPSEVAPLVDDLNVLLAQREKMVERALAKAGDLAHGLKTPLSLLAREADAADGAGQAWLAASLRAQVAAMRRQIDYQLAQARAAGAAPHARCALAPCAEALVRTLARLHAERELALEVDVAAHLAVRAQREDLDEMLGNLLDNACQWARRRVELSAVAVGANLEIRVDDDGPGLAADLRAGVLERGVRADQRSPGSGLGLAIVRDLAELCGGAVELADSPLGGLRAVLRLPSAS